MFKILGLKSIILVLPRVEKCAAINYDKRFGRSEESVRTPLGRVAILTSIATLPSGVCFCMSKLKHWWILLRDTPDNFVKYLQKSFRFVSNGKPERKTIKDVKSGVLNILTIKTYLLTLKLI